MQSEGVLRMHDHIHPSGIDTQRLCFEGRQYVERIIQEIRDNIRNEKKIADSRRRTQRTAGYFEWVAKFDGRRYKTIESDSERQHRL